MKKAVVLTIRGRQSYADQEPEEIQLVTEGTLEQVEKGWEVSYEESDLTGLQGVITTFLVTEESICLSRKGRLNSQMVFREGVSHDSLYKTEFGTMMLTVCATKVAAEIKPDGGSIDLRYNIEIEQSAAGVIDYRLDIQMK